MVAQALMPVDGINLCVETFGEPTDPAVLLIAGAGNSMDWWEDEFCRRLAAGVRFVIRYDHRDTGRSTSFPPGAPPYSLPDLAADALGVLDALGLARAHLVGLGLGGALALRLAIDHPQRLLSLTLMATDARDRPAPFAPPADPAPATAPPAASASTTPPTDPAPATTPPASAAPATTPPASAAPATTPPASAAPATTPPASAAPATTPPASAAPATTPPTGVAGTTTPADWSDRRASVRRIIAGVLDRGGPFTADEPHLRRLAERVYDRTPDMAAGQANHLCCPAGPPIGPRPATITTRTLVLHGTLDRVVPAAHARALAAGIPGARLVWLEGVGHEFPPAAVWSQVIAEITGQPARGRQPA